MGSSELDLVRHRLGLVSHVVGLGQSGVKLSLGSTTAMLGHMQSNGKLGLRLVWLILFTAKLFFRPYSMLNFYHIEQLS